MVHAAAWRTWEADRDTKPWAFDAFEVGASVKLGGARFVNIKGLGRAVSALVRLAPGHAPQVIARDPYGPVELVPDRCADIDGDGRPEALVAIGGDSERSYQLLRFLDGRPSPVTTFGCGD